MDDLDDECNSSGADNWVPKYTNWEMECINRLETTPDLDQQIELEKGGNARKLWVHFQTAACSIAQLYQSREQNVSVWNPFQNAASAVTTLYKECIESQKRFFEFGLQSGQQKRNKELLSWLKKRKRQIRREDLIAYLSGATSQGHPLHHHYHHPHHRTWGSPKPRLSISDSTGRCAFTRLSLSDGLSDGNSNLNTDTSNTTDETDLETFREALSFSGIRRSGSPGSQSSDRNNIYRQNNRSPSIRVSNHSNNSYEELDAFISEEYNRHVESRKRVLESTSDVIMDSPTHKRSKYT
ncbi:HUWE1-associated protein modifying stress responses-like [Oppia nitens]|uniref:HUWE1-associated protein modifying stress responses-like n=1 Tax=Oppia nitens TaxID=1686743 RepID=UPI0023DB95EC|nr:HUWE1-associated protein modifying stress responses-like [Oppia nitens]